MEFKSFYLFATRADYLEMIDPIEQAAPLKYVLCGNFPERTVITYDVASEIETIGVARGRSHISEDCYLILESKDPIVVRDLHPESGPSRYIIDMLKMPDTVSLIPGGRHGDRIMICGLLACRKDSPKGVELFSKFAKHIRKHFKRPPDSAFWFGLEAALLAKAEPRIRFVSDVDSPDDYNVSWFREH